DLAEQIAEEALRIELRAGLERQEAAELAGDAADLLAESGIAEPSADQPAQLRADLAEQIAEKSLRIELRAGLERQEREEVAAAEAVVVAAQLWAAEPPLRSDLRAGFERENASQDAASGFADRLAEIAVAELAADKPASQIPQCGAKQAAEKSLWRKLLICELLICEHTRQHRTENCAVHRCVHRLYPPHPPLWIYPRHESIGGNVRSEHAHGSCTGDGRTMDHWI